MKMRIILISFLIFVSTSALFADYNIKQLSDGWWLGSTPSQTGQSFTTLYIIGDLTSVTVFQWGQINTTLRIYKGEVFSPANEIYSQAVNSGVTGSQVVTLTLDEPVPVEQGTKYTFVFDSAILLLDITNPYSGGRMYGTGSWQNNFDAYFKLTFVSEPGAIPTMTEWAAIVLGSLFVVVGGWFVWRKFS